MLSQAVYIAVGLLGLPVFSAGGGFSYVLTPTFGFLLGFIACAGLLSALARRDLAMWTGDKTRRLRRFARIAAGSLFAVLAMYILGIAYMLLMFNVYLHSPRTLGFVIENAALPFVFIDIAKLSLALPLSAAVMRRLPHRIFPAK
jgi:biotin transport system substrate-specific component